MSLQTVITESALCATGEHVEILLDTRTVVRTHGSVPDMRALPDGYVHQVPCYDKIKCEHMRISSYSEYVIQC